MAFQEIPNSLVLDKLLPTEEALTFPVPFNVYPDSPEGILPIYYWMPPSYKDQLVVDIVGEECKPPNSISVYRRKKAGLQIELWDFSQRSIVLEAPVGQVDFHRSNSGLWVIDTSEVPIAHDHGFDTFVYLVAASTRKRQQEKLSIQKAA